MPDGTRECSKAEQAESPRELADRLKEAEALLAIASAISSTRDFQEALRRVCRELARLIGAETASVHLLDRSSGLLRPFAGYHLPKEHLPILSTAPVRLKDQGFYLPLWKEKRPVYSDDVPHDSRFSDELFRLIPHQSGLLLPLVLDDEVEGAFYLVWWTARRRFTERELALMDTVSGQATLLLRNTRLFEQADHDRRRLAALYEVGRRLAGAHLTEEVLSLIVNESAQLLGAEAAGLRLLEGDDLVVAARTESAVGIMASPRLKVGVGLTGLVVTSGEPLAVEDISQSSLLDPDDPITKVGGGFLGFLSVPLRSKDRIIGALNVYTRSRRRFSQEDISVLSAFADQASLAIEKAGLYQRAEERARKLTVLTALTHMITSTRDVQQVFHAVAEAATTLLGAQMSRVWIEDPVSRGLRAQESFGIDPRRDQLMTELAFIPYGQGLIGRIFESRKPEYVPDVQQDSRWLNQRLAKEAGFHAYAGIPLIAGERVVGVLTILFTDHREFSPEEKELMHLLADHAGIAIENSRLYCESADRVKALEEALARVRQLQGLLPICAWCKKIRRDQNYWQSVESYVTEQTDARFSHGICPECKGKLVTRRDANG